MKSFKKYLTAAAVAAAGAVCSGGRAGAQAV